MAQHQINFYQDNLPQKTSLQIRTPLHSLSPLPSMIQLRPTFRRSFQRKNTPPQGSREPKYSPAQNICSSDWYSAGLCRSQISRWFIATCRRPLAEIPLNLKALLHLRIPRWHRSPHHSRQPTVRQKLSPNGPASNAPQNPALKVSGTPITPYPPSLSSSPTDRPGTSPNDLPQNVPAPNYFAGSSLPSAPPSGPISGSIELQTPDDAPHSGSATKHPAGPDAHQDVSRNIRSRDVNVLISIPAPSLPTLAISIRCLSTNASVAPPPNASASSISPAIGPPPTDGSQPLPSLTSLASADASNWASTRGPCSQPRRTEQPSCVLRPPLPQSAPVDGSAPTDLPYVVQSASVPPSSSSLPPVNDPTPTGLSQPIPAPNSPAPINSAVPTGVPMPNISSAPVKGPTSSDVPPVPVPDSPAASVLPSVPPVDETPKLSGVPDVDARIVLKMTNVIGA
ncbi:uncharacterized protein LACBIDRAFT_333067 [Laccaria bicolor S238N-H82]|uniref:Uncharacterized protein n=1 Tax=Laccaria bicolor (strain S238N-H82 / ATCC MYA-4686) TaxID=486041 RepID=B0DUR6_LACBS|nr:uncharacterized protein LACBIDRAFT_333067 [Laccaria bicolor S238N-H82]EDR01658.1 hypothetical protein LACBIDRAFT_333067 [Laccaria bicolor S238N-H82]|eukprot:XP_001887734.1 hypothetical protein LACBIDRAFT_333067 [Laccaria bicolor S238N-H82]